MTPPVNFYRMERNRELLRKGSSHCAALRARIGTAHPPTCGEIYCYHAQLKEFHGLVEEFRRLRDEAVQLRVEMIRPLELLRANIESLLEEQRVLLFSSERRLRADVVTFEPATNKVH